MTDIPVNDLARVQPEVAGAVDAAVARVVRSGRYTMGPELEGFERELAAFVGTRFATGVASGSDALYLALAALGCGPGDEVVTVANACAFTTIAVVALGATPRLVDVEAGTLLVDPGAVAEALTPQTRAVVVTHLYGQLAAVAELADLCRRAGVALVEDCAQAIGAQRHGQRAGSFGTIAAFSFYPTKNLGALGDGGAVVTSDPGLAEAVAGLRQYGWGERDVVERCGGRNSRLDEVQAAALRAKLPYVGGWNDRRRAIRAQYAEAVRPDDGRMLGREGSDDVVHLAVLDATDRPAVRARLAGAGVGTAIHYPVPDHRQPAFADRFRGVHLPVTERAADRILTLPCFPGLTDAEVDRVCTALAG